MIDGPKGVGKTATAAKHARTVHQLDSPDKLQFVTADTSLLTTGDAPIRRRDGVAVVPLALLGP